MPHTVLLVDDDRNLLSSMKRSLHREQYDILCASSAKEALDLLRARSVDVIVSDQEMPGMSGTEFLRRAHLEFPNTIRLMLTGKATLEVAVEAINEGAISRFFIKPCNIIDLAISIRQGIQQRELLVQANRMLKKLKIQSDLLVQVEHISPGITKVNRLHDGAIVLDDIPHDIDKFMDRIREALS